MNSVAKRCDIPEATMRGYFKGRFPTTDKAFTIATKLDVNLDWLVGGIGSKEGCLTHRVLPAAQLIIVVE
ncbi:helix-turn-helix transcriptional regulator [Rhizobium sp. BK008]|uniref:helix-turn-helix domain-containing protein n=1 Tax=Rhizobium sp. BK008 TaxID=2587094 RepID=UPI0016182A89